MFSACYCFERIAEANRGARRMLEAMMTGRIHMRCLARVKPAAFALSSLLLGLDVTLASAQTPLMKELVRKAQSKEQEDGFCARTAWPLGDSSADFAAFLRKAATESQRATTFSNGACVFNLVTRVHMENGNKCVSYTYYTCSRGAACGLGKSVDCLRPDGTYSRRSD